MTREKQIGMLRDFLVEIRRYHRIGISDSKVLAVKAQGYVKAYMDLGIIDCVEACETYREYIDW